MHTKKDKKNKLILSASILKITLQLSFEISMQLNKDPFRVSYYVSLTTYNEIKSAVWDEPQSKCFI